MAFRRRHGAPSWHSCPTCPDWPTQAGTYEEKQTRPMQADVDEVCLRLEKAGECRA